MDLICDANSLYARSYFAAEKISPDCSQTLRLAAVTVLNILHPDTNRIDSLFKRTMFCWDSQVNEAKKRTPKPDNYYEMREIAKDLFTLLLGTIHVEQPPFEGDDLVASAITACGPDRDVYILSGDKDLMQLAGKHVRYYSLHEKCVLSDSFMCAKFHVHHPAQIAIALAIQGDPVDSISGVKGWGPVKVKNLFSQIPKHFNFEETVTALVNEMTQEQQEQFYAALNRTLLNTDIPVPPPAEITFADEREVADLKMPEASFRFREVKFIYEHEPF